MPTTYASDMPTWEGKGQFMKSLLFLLSESGPGAQCAVGLEEMEDGWNVIVEIHNPCDGAEHDNCVITGKMNKATDKDFEESKGLAQALADGLDAIFDRITNIAEKPPEDSGMPN